MTIEDNLAAPDLPPKVVAEVRAAALREPTLVTLWQCPLCKVRASRLPDPGTHPPGRFSKPGANCTSCLQGTMEQLTLNAITGAIIPTTQA